MAAHLNFAWPLARLFSRPRCFKTQIIQRSLRRGGKWASCKSPTRSQSQSSRKEGHSCHARMRVYALLRPDMHRGVHLLRLKACALQRWFARKRALRAFRKRTSRGNSGKVEEKDICSELGRPKEIVFSACVFPACVPHALSLLHRGILQKLEAWPRWERAIEPSQTSKCPEVQRASLRKTKREDQRES